MHRPREPRSRRSALTQLDEDQLLLLIYTSVLQIVVTKRAMTRAKRKLVALRDESWARRRYGRHGFGNKALDEALRKALKRTGSPYNAFSGVQAPTLRLSRHTSITGTVEERIDL
jgi:hypothetical protein